MDKISLTGYCFTCGGMGFVDKECPTCHKKATKTVLLSQESIDKGFIEKINVYGVPKKYQGIVWSAEELKHFFHDKESDYNFQRFVAQLEKIDKIFATGHLPPKSAIIIAPAGYSKMTFAYSCIQRALDKGLSVAPLLDTVELKRLLSLAAENPSYKMYGISFEEYVLSDVIFVTVTKLRQREWAYEVIEEILDIRTRKGLSTFIISRYDLSEISRRDLSNSFEAICNTTSQDVYKYPAIIRYRDLGGK